MAWVPTSGGSSRRTFQRTGGGASRAFGESLLPSVVIARPSSSPISAAGRNRLVAGSHLRIRQLRDATPSTTCFPEDPEACEQVAPSVRDAGARGWNSGQRSKSPQSGALAWPHLAREGASKLALHGAFGRAEAGAREGASERAPERELRDNRKSVSERSERTSHPRFDPRPH